MNEPPYADLAEGDRISRRTLLSAGVAISTVVGTAGCARRQFVGGEEPTDSEPPPEAELGDPDRTFELTATPNEIKVGPEETVEMWVYNDQYPGPELRVEEGELVRIIVENDLPADTSVHWHGMTLFDANEMDGVPGVTQEPIGPGQDFGYEFEAHPSGTHWYHSHVGLQLDRGLLGPLIVEEADPHVEYDREHTIILDEYLTSEPEVTTNGKGMMGGFPGAPPYDGTLVNGELPAEPDTVTVEAGERVRLRCLNAGSASTYQVAVAGHPMTITHADGPAVEPVEVDTFEIGMGERFDAIIEADQPGAWEIQAEPVDDETPAGRAILQYEEADDDPRDDRPGNRLLDYSDLEAIDSLDQHRGSPDRTLELNLAPGGMMGGDDDEWTIDGQAYPEADPLRIEEGEHVRVHVVNHSPMRHPMHLHGHHFEMEGALHDTVTVPGHMGERTLDFLADNPGEWMFHCHNSYHMETGMVRVFEYD